MNPRFARLWQDKRWRRTALLLALWVPAVVVLIAVREVLLPFLLAITFAYVLAPIVNRLSSIQVRHKKIPRVGAVFVVYAVLAGILWLVAAIVVPRLYHEAAHLAKDAGAVLNQADDHHIDAISEQLENFFDANNLPVRMVDDEGMST
ncbi:MAG TPA: AI-2E family transporter, partial [Myxococcota bacterium]